MKSMKSAINSLNEKRIFSVSDEICKHEYIAFGIVKEKEVQLVIDRNGNKFCPICERDKEMDAITKKETAEYLKFKSEEIYNSFYRLSVISDKTILEADFNNFIAEEKEEIANKQKALDYIKDYKNGQVFNVIMTGSSGAGKSHLAYSMLKSLNEERNVKCLFISVSEMFNLIKDSFQNKESKFTEGYFNRLIIDADFVVLDDLGAEVGTVQYDDKGNITTKAASDFINRTLFNIADKRQGKSTIYTTNLSSKEIAAIYDKRLKSRILSKPKSIVFRETSDKRFQLDF